MKTIIIILLVVALVFVGYTMYNDKKDMETKFVLYCGLTDATSGEQLLTVADAIPTARKVILDREIGYTEYVAYGGRAENGMVKENDTLIYVLTFIDRAEAEEIADEIMKKLNIDYVLIEETTAKLAFVD